MILTLVRHGEVLKEYQGRYNGHIDITLSDNGKLQAKELAKKLSHIKFDKIYSSDLLRAKETLMAFEPKVAICFTERLREKSWGRHEGKSFEEITARGIKYENFVQWINALDGEDIEGFVANVKDFFEQTIFKQNAKHILIITHAGVIKTLLCLTKNISLEEAFSTPLPYGHFITLDTMSL
jgi:broad specificity phosphatase PhoE